MNRTLSHWTYKAWQESAFLVLTMQPFQWFVKLQYLEPLLSDHPLQNSNCPLNRGWPLNRGSLEIGIRPFEKVTLFQYKIT